MSLLEQTESMLEHLVKSGVSLRQIARDCGDSVDYEWLKKFKAGKIDGPSVNRIQTLHDRLLALKPDCAA